MPNGHKPLEQSIEAIFHHYINNLLGHIKSGNPIRIDIAKNNYDFIFKRMYILYSQGYNVDSITERFAREVHPLYNTHREVVYQNQPKGVRNNCLEDCFDIRNEGKDFTKED